MGSEARSIGAQKMGGDASSDTGDTNQSTAPESEMPGTFLETASSNLEEETPPSSGFGFCTTGPNRLSDILEEETPPSSGFGFCTTGPRFCGGDDDPPSSNGEGFGVFCCASTGRDQGTLPDGEPDEDDSLKQRLRYRAAFDLIDEDKSDTIDEGELQNAMSLMDLSIEAETSEKMLEEVRDAGGVNFDEFVALLELYLSKEQLQKVGTQQDPLDERRFTDPKKTDISAAGMMELQALTGEMNAHEEEEKRKQKEESRQQEREQQQRIMQNLQNEKDLKLQLEKAEADRRSTDAAISRAADLKARKITGELKRSQNEKGELEQEMKNMKEENEKKEDAIAKRRKKHVPKVCKLMERLNQFVEDKEIERVSKAIQEKDIALARKDQKEEEILQLEADRVQLEQSLQLGDLVMVFPNFKSEDAKPEGCLADMCSRATEELLNTTSKKKQLQKRTQKVQRLLEAMHIKPSPDIRLHGMAPRIMLQITNEDVKDSVIEYFKVIDDEDD